ncbi:MAG: AmmeMemoRadiSam system radical SAM enzyme [Thermovirgaceae bacterium]
MSEGQSGGTGRPALWWHRENQMSRCDLCPHECLVGRSGRGRCLVRKGTAEGLVTENDGKVASVAPDPVEKKPLFHWRPGALILSLGTIGCNLDCPFCQNWELARCSRRVRLADMEPDDVVLLAKREKTGSVAFTYNEPTVWYEFVLRTSRRLRQENLDTVLVTNGYIKCGPWNELLPLVSAVNIDLKGFSGDSYRQVGGSLGPVLERIDEAIEAKVHVELTHLVVPGINDDDAEFCAMVDWISERSPSIPLHISRYFPHHRWNRPPTSVELLKRYAEYGKRKLHYVYLGNVEHESQTVCPGCKTTVMRRKGYRTENIGVDKNGRCGFCNTPLGIVMK